eukprot:GHRR01018140.1.p1 GENE.GHRR01018140.1~~GHRR01018140.1.p1  ORF type:complete len:479 (+),score=174.94 GHRR01018140.1:564-2000(+)
MIFIGFGFLMTFLRRYGFGAIGFNFFCSCLVMLEGVLIIGAVQQVLGKGQHLVTLELPLLIDATFCAGSAMIAYGAVLGKTTPTQLMWLMVGLVPFYALNQHLVFRTLQALDMGGSITIHAFGAYYGLAASLVLSNGRQAPGAYTSCNIKNSATYTSNLFSMIGTIFLWMYWPSFNGALASIEAGPEGITDPTTALQLPQQYYCVVNTLLSLLGSCVSTFMMSSFLNQGKYDMMHVQNATLAGGVAMGSASALKLSPGGAVAVGLFAGILSTTGFGRLSPILESKIGLGDTCGVHNLHGMPGLLGGLVAGLAAFSQLPGVTAHGNTQLGYQILALVCTVIVAAGSGALVCAAATGRLGTNQAKALNSIRQRAGADDYTQGSELAANNGAAIDGLALFEDHTFWTETPLETFYSGAMADGTNYSRRTGSQHMKAGSSHHVRSPSHHGGKDVVAAAATGVAAGVPASPRPDQGLYSQQAV